MSKVIARPVLTTSRVRKLQEEARQTPPQLSTERLRFLWDTYRENEGQPAIIKMARLFEKTLSEMTIFIDENPIVGTMTKYLAGCNPMPEWSCKWMLNETGRYPSHLGEIIIAEDDMPLLRETANYWKDKCVEHKRHQIFRQVHKDADSFQLAACGVCSQAAQLMVQAVMNYGKVLTKGLEGILHEAEEALAHLPLGGPEYHAKRNFYNAVIISHNAVIKFARRYASLARKMSEQEKDSQRKEELLKIAEMCEWIPAKPARSFREAIQSFWFIDLAGWIEGPQTAASLGRFAEYMYPFYKNDKDNGRINEEEAIELLELVFLKIQALQIFQSSRAFLFHGGNTGNHITLGGVTARGEDATNELDFLVLEAQRRVRVTQPTLSVLFHDKMSEEFLVKCVDVVRETGLGQPAFFNNDICIERAFCHHPGISVAEARNGSLIGCVESAVSNSQYFTVQGAFNLAKMVELALNNGKDPLTGAQIGPQTGNAEKFQSYEELHAAVRKQLQYFMPLCLEIGRVCYDLYAEFLPLPFQSALVDGCLQNGKDLYLGGARYNVGGAIMVAGIDLANSLAAIKKVVFEEKFITMRELLEALRLDFEGKEEMHQMLLRAPKFGNDDDYVDEIAREWYEIAWEEHQKFAPYPTPDSTHIPQAFSNTLHAWFGGNTGALPCGRKARIALTDASVSPMPGTDINGPTALVKSAAKAIDTVKYGSNHLNMKFHPSALAGREGARKLLALIKSYMDLGGFHVQFNCVTNETLRDAQAHPENYRDLVVRVAGYSAYFVHLDKAVQDEIIKRTEIVFR